MHGIRLSLMCLFSLSALSLAGTPDVVKQLKAYYEEGDKTPPYKAAIAKLASMDVKEREQASAWLVAILGQSLKDEKSGTAPWRATPFWGSSGENPAQNLRSSIARTLAEMKEVPVGALPALRWFFDEEYRPALQHDATVALNTINTPEAAKLRSELVLKPHENLVVVAKVLEKIAKAKEKVPADKLLPLCQHHRASVREAARVLHKQQGGIEPAPFDPQKAIRSPAVQKLLKKIDEMLIDKPATDATWVVASITVYDDNKKERHKYDQRGWLLKEDGDKSEIFTPFGWRETVRKSVKLTRDTEREDWWTCSIAKGNIETEVARVEKVRKEGVQNFEFSEAGGLTGQFQGQGASLYEIILVQHLHASGKDALAARILFPALETLYSDDGVVNILRHELGKIYGYQMLVAFAGDRDYKRTEQIARTLKKHYPDTIFYDYAVRLAEELPKRRDDFVKLKLPTPKDWVVMKRKLTRAEQIDFLCQRYRLLNYFQWGQPGGYVRGATQYAEPCGMKRNASWGLEKGKTEVINPETELAGVRSFVADDEKKPRGLELTLKDVPQLSKYLSEDWLMPTVTFWRDFHPDRNLSSTRPLFASIINGLAMRDICKIDNWHKLKPAEIDKEIERINRWALANADKTESQLRWETLEDSVASGRGFRTIEFQLEWFLEQKDTKVYGVMKQLLEKEKTDAYEKSQILQMYLRHDPARAKDLAPKYLDHKESYLRFKAALIVFQTGDKSKARTVLGDTLETESIDSWCKQAVELLLKDGSPASRDQVARLFKNEQLPRGGFSHETIRGEILRLCVKAGMKDPYSYYLKQLDNNEVAFVSFSNRDDKQIQTTYAQVHAREIVAIIASDDPAVKEITRNHAKDVDQIPHLKKWLRVKISGK